MDDQQIRKSCLELAIENAPDDVLNTAERYYNFIVYGKSEVKVIDKSK